MKEPEQEIAVETMKLVFSLLLPDPSQSVGEIIRIAIKPTLNSRIQEAFALDKVDEHEAIEHERGIPLPVSQDSNPLNELEKGGMFQLEPVEELLGHPLHVEGSGHT